MRLVDSESCPSVCSGFQNAKFIKAEGFICHSFHWCGCNDQEQVINGLTFGSLL